MRYAAQYYDGRTARTQHVEVAVTEAGIDISSEPEVVTASWPAERIMLAELPRDGEPVRLGLDGTTARLIVDDPNVVDTLRPLAPRLYRRVRLSWRDIARIAVWADVATASIATIVLVVIPSFSKQMAAVTPDTVRQRIGYATLRQLTRLLPINGHHERARRAPYCSDADGLDALGEMTVRLTSDVTDVPRERLVVVNTQMVNAFALPGNIVVVTKGLIDNAENAEEVAGVVAHELGHVALDHPIQGMYARRPCRYWWAWS